MDLPIENSACESNTPATQSVGDGIKEHDNQHIPQNLSGYELAKRRQKEADRRIKENKKRKFDMFTPEEKEAMKRQRHEDEERCKRNMQTLMKHDMPVQVGSKAPITVCVDCSLDHEHQDRERRSLCKQMCYGYAYVKKTAIVHSSTPVRLCVSGLCPQTAASSSASSSEQSTAASVDVGGQPKDVLFNSLMKQGILNWNVLLFRESIWDVPRFNEVSSADASAETFVASDSTTAAVAVDDITAATLEGVEAESAPATANPHKPNPLVSVGSLSPSSLFCQSSSFVMLSPDATDVITHFDPDKVYIIGGIVDRSVRSQRSLSLSAEQGIQCLRLPIQEFIPTRYTHVLNVDTVLRIICLYCQYDGDWKRALEEAVPLRKQGKSANQLRDKDSVEDGGEDGKPTPPTDDA